jgi:hypothetical protein
MSCMEALILMLSGMQPVAAARAQAAKTDYPITSYQPKYFVAETIVRA